MCYLVNHIFKKNFFFWKFVSGFFVNSDPETGSELILFSLRFFAELVLSRFHVIVDVKKKNFK